MTSKDVSARPDPQLERAVADALRLLQRNPVVLKHEPPPPIRARRRLLLRRQVAIEFLDVTA